MKAKQETSSTVSGWRIIGVGFLVGLLLNITGWLGNNFLLGSMWSEVGASIIDSPWRDSIYRDVFSFVPDLIYGFAIAYLCVALRYRFAGFIPASLAAGLVVAIIGGITTYFAIANSGFIPWKLAFASFALVLATKLPLALLAGSMLEPKSEA